MERKLVNGSCHCGFIKYRANIKLNTETGTIDPALRYNCTFCTKLCITYHYLDGPQDFELIAPGSVNDVAVYAPNVKSCPRHFCDKCGVHVWISGYYEWEGQRHGINAIMIPTIDQPQEGVDLSKVRVKYKNMLEDQLGQSRETPYPHGLL